MVVELGDEHQFAHTAQGTISVYIGMDGLDLPVSEEAQLLQLSAIGTIDVDGVGMQVDVVIVEVLGCHGCLFALGIELCGELLQEVVPQEELRRHRQRTEQQSPYDKPYLKCNPPHRTPIIVRR